jgi:amino acid adenylation domain-containing protein
MAKPIPVEPHGRTAPESFGLPAAPEGALPFSLVAFQVLLHRYTGEDIVVVEIRSSNRVESVSADFSENPEFQEIHRQAGRTLGSRWKLPVEFSALVHTLASPQRQGPDRLAVSLTETGRHIASDALEPWLLRQIARHFRHLLRTAAAHPAARISDIEMLSQADRRRILVEWNDTRQEYFDCCIHELYEQQAERTPDAVAIIYKSRQWTYSELNARANRLANYLRKLGVGPEILVGVCLERSADAIVALLGILKAGGAYVYLDPAYPFARLWSMVDDAGVGIVVTRSALRNRIFRDDRKRLFVEHSSPEIAAENSTNVRSGVKPDHAAYVIYTSGSTGRPKGAVEIHRSMTSRLKSSPLPDIQSGDVCALNSSLSFGISASRLFLPLVSGAPVVVFGDDLVRNAGEFAHALKDHRVTSVFLVPALLRRILDLPPDAIARLSGLRAVALSGGAVTPDLLSSFAEKLPGTLLVNIYGSTELGTTATLGVLHGSAAARRVSLGRPVVNTRVYILDKYGNPAPPGVAGEIQVASLHLARGYLNHPQLTAQRFVRNPFGGPAERLCRTGDLGRYLPDGEIEFLGRADHQVKIRGFRIELGEVEAVLSGHGWVQEAVVAALGPEAERRLVAYIVPRKGCGFRSSELRAYLREKVPDFMIPSAFVQLDRLPLTSAGKVDRGALPEPGPLRPEEAGAPYRPPRTPMEAFLSEVWTEVLGIEPVGRDDRFAELGGDSLAAVLVVTRIVERFDTTLSVQFLLEATLAELARKVESLRLP